LINLYCGGRSSLKHFDKEGLKVVLNFGFLHSVPDILFWGDEIVGDRVFEYYKEKPNFKLVALRRNGGKAKDWVDEWYAYDFGVFTTVWALMWLRERYPNEKILVYGLDGDGISYYDGVIEQPELRERIRRLNVCYSQLDQLPKDNVFNMNPNSPYKGFPYLDRI